MIGGKARLLFEHDEIDFAFSWLLATFHTQLVWKMKTENRKFYR
ncbi:hypothetical protein GTCCBUS3UF5_4210 [Geobacillus thermoleovorans CCB_US3_UF5]|uniref:Uncharacterized protein n=2 Tax=Geobacillus thermoleovorans group TaxID=1505648 RepID=U2Y7K1_GEOKU|nr:hypothetical protein GTCCBUS3UF5_4210 [Geobacillus thermoleovorans CCB_US3_UF5]GAD15344.1 hypothetical protein GBL_3561 [Geobacillus kaustophilus GBlys]GAJ60383.1 hypothetical protein B23_3628 [Geobacillus thermoleovorans B23]